MAINKLHLYIILIVALATIIVSSCSKDESWADNYITNLAELQTDAKGKVTQMHLDNGQSYNVSNTITLERPDTIYRYLCIYVEEGNKARIVSSSPTFSPTPIDTVGVEILNDPCTIQSIWLSGNYLNARMLVQGKDQSHIIGFLDLGFTENPNGSKTLTLQLYHDQNNDPEAFTRTIYLSCPLKKYSDKLKSGTDSVHFVVNQYDKGLTTFALPY